jgi:DNA polymerase elongation subunit (family B)
VSDIDPIADPEWRATPRMITIDIEVLSPDGFPEPEDAAQPVTGITAHDNHTDEYRVFLLRPSEWNHSDTEISNMAIEERPEGTSVSDVSVFEDEDQMLEDFNNYVENKQPDLLSGWNSSSTDKGSPFDYPYLINRCQALNVLSFKDWSPLNQVWDGSWGPSGKGVQFFDMMKAYKKTQFSKPNGGYGLENIASKELDYGKEDIDDIDEAYFNDPRTFIKYNMRDVSAVVGIDESAGVLDLFQNIRALAGVQFENCHNPIDTLDPYIIRFANNNGFALPTNETPDRGWYYGAYVFDSKPGRHRNVIYFDVSSLYPNIMYQTNMSPETIIGTKADLEASEYTKDDCCISYVDTRNDNVKKNDSPEYEKLYYLKPSVKEGFMKQIIENLLELKDYYDGTDLYQAVKGLVNSVYGIAGDSNSYGKGFRLYDWRMAESITLQGRKIIKECADWGTDQTSGVVTNGDTDGVGITMGDNKSHEEVVNEALKLEDEMTEYIKNWCEETLDIEESTMKMEAEKLMDPVFVPTDGSGNSVKKKYSYLKVWEQ